MGVSEGGLWGPKVEQYGRDTSLIVVAIIQARSDRGLD